MMPPHQKRVLEEKEQLDERIEKLEGYLDDTDRVAKLSPDERELLGRQLSAMQEYSAILEERISLFRQ
jgi:hypothetical protein